MNQIKKALTFKSILHGLAVAIVTSFLTALTAIMNNGTLPTPVQIKSIAIASLAAGISYILKNILMGSSAPGVPEN